MSDRYEHKRIEQLIPAAPGWRAVYAMDPGGGRDPDECGPTEVMWMSDVAAFALVEVWWDWEECATRPPDDLEPEWQCQRVEPVVVEEGVAVGLGADLLRIGLLGPNDGDTDQRYLKEQARRAIERDRAARWHAEEAERSAP